jgi:hypothetical protein
MLFIKMKNRAYMVATLLENLVSAAIKKVYFGQQNNKLENWGRRTFSWKFFELLSI